MNFSELSGQIDSLISRRQTAGMLGLSSKTIYRYERAGLLTPVRLNSRVIRYSLRAVQELIAAGHGVATDCKALKTVTLRHAAEEEV